MGSNNKEIIEYLDKILARVEYIQSTVNGHSKDFTQIHSEIGTYRSEISTYRSEILSFSTNLHQLEKDYTSEKKRFDKADYMLETHEKSIAEIISIKAKVHSCTYCNKHPKDQFEIGGYIG